MGRALLRLALVAAAAACGFEGPAAGGGEPGPDAREDDVDGGPDPLPDAAPATCLEPPEGIVAWWDGEELGVDIAGDFSMTSSSGTPEVAPGLIGNATTIDDSDANEWVTIQGAPRPAQFTVEGWVRRTVDDNDFQTVYGRDCDSGVFLFQHRLTFFFDDVIGCGRRVVTGSTALERDAWHHVAATYDGDRVRLYVDGSPEGDGQVAASLPDPGRIGGIPIQDGQSLVGQIDELTIYDRALDGDEIALIATALAGKCKPAVDLQ